MDSNFQFRARRAGVLTGLYRRRPSKVFAFPPKRPASCTRDRWFESVSLQRRVCEPSVPEERSPFDPEPIWLTKSETASRVRGRIEAVLDWATSRGLRQGENPARWRGHLDKLLPPRSKVRRVRHHPALRYAEIGGFMAALRSQDGVAARALE